MAPSSTITFGIAEGMVYMLTPCCGASATGVSVTAANPAGVACRACYAPMPAVMGWADMLDSATLATGLAHVLRELGLSVRESNDLLLPLLEAAHGITPAVEATCPTCGDTAEYCSEFAARSM